MDVWIKIVESESNARDGSTLYVHNHYSNTPQMDTRCRDESDDPSCHGFGLSVKCESVKVSDGVVVWSLPYYQIVGVLWRYVLEFSGSNLMWKLCFWTMDTTHIDEINTQIPHIYNFLHVKRENHLGTLKRTQKWMEVHFSQFSDRQKRIV